MEVAAQIQPVLHESIEVYRLYESIHIVVELAAQIHPVLHTRHTEQPLLCRTLAIEALAARIKPVLQMEQPEERKAYILYAGTLCVGTLLSSTHATHKTSTWCPGCSAAAVFVCAPDLVQLSFNPP